MRTNIVRNIIDTDKLSAEIDRYEIITNQNAYLFIHTATIDCMKNAISNEELYPCMELKNSNCCSSGIIAKFQGRKVYIDDDLKFGEVEIR